MDGGMLRVLRPTLSDSPAPIRALNPLDLRSAHMSAVSGQQGHTLPQEHRTDGSNTELPSQKPQFKYLDALSKGACAYSTAE